MKTYTLEICGLTRELPIIKIDDNLSIASFVILGDTELVKAAGAKLSKQLPDCQILISAEAKGIPLIHEVSHHLNKNYIVARKSIKTYMKNPLITEVNSVTTAEQQILCLDQKDADKIAGKKVTIIDDVISTGASIKAIENLVEEAGGEVVARAAILAEGKARGRDDIIYLEELPLFDGDGNKL